MTRFLQELIIELFYRRRRRGSVSCRTPSKRSLRFLVVSFVVFVLFMVIYQIDALLNDPARIEEREVRTFLDKFERSMNDRQFEKRKRKLDGVALVDMKSKLQSLLASHLDIIKNRKNIDPKDIPKVVPSNFIEEMGPFSGIAKHGNVLDNDVFTQNSMRTKKRLSPVEETMPNGGLRMLGNNVTVGSFQPIPILPDITSDQATFFISLAAYRDEYCESTISSVYKEARFPERVFIGVVRQQEPNDPFRCINALYVNKTCQLSAFCPVDNIRIRFQPTTMAKGPTQGRYISLLMYQGEQFAMIIDSHTRFAPLWDLAMIEEVWSFPHSGKRIEDVMVASPTEAFEKDDLSDGRTRGKGGVISHYPPAFSDFNYPFNWNLNILTIMCSAHYLRDTQTRGLIRMDGTNLIKKPLPRLQPFTAAGFLFGDAAFVLDVPFDPYLDFLFDGEEILYTTRLWTHGYDSYSPSKGVVAHIYGRPKAPRVWSVPNNEWWRHQSAAHLRYHYFMETYSLVERNPRGNLTPKPVPPNSILVDFESLEKANKSMEAETYGMGSERKIDNFYRWAGIDRNGWVIDSRHCKA